MKLSNLDLLCSAPLKQSGASKSSNPEGISSFQALFSELQLDQRNLKDPITIEGELTSDLVEDEDEIELQIDVVVLADRETISDAKEEPIVSSEQEIIQQEHSEVDLPVVSSIHLEPVKKHIELPKVFIELPRRPITMVDLPKTPLPVPISVSLFERNQVFEGEESRKTNLNFSVSATSEKMEGSAIENSPLKTVEPTASVALNKELVASPIQPNAEEVSIHSEPTKKTSEVVLENELVALSKPSEFSLHIPEDVPELEFLRHELPRVLLNPLKGSVNTQGGTFRIQIFPEHLGHIDLMVTVEEGQLTAKMTTSSHLTKDVLETQLPQLRQQLTDVGVSIESLEIEWRDSRESPERQAQQQQPESRKQRSFMESNQQEPNESDLPQDDSFDFSV